MLISLLTTERLKPIAESSGNPRLTTTTVVITIYYDDEVNQLA